MRKFILTILIFTFLAFSACNNLKAKYDYPKTTSKKEEIRLTENDYPKRTDWRETINNRADYKKLITNKVDIHEFVQTQVADTVYGKGTNTTIDFNWGIECLRKTEQGAIYSVHEVKQGGLLYVFYIESDKHLKMIRWFNVRKKLCFNDFSDLKGKSIDEVKKVDPSAQIYENIFNSSQGKYKESSHYLTDGLLYISYKLESGQYIVKELYYQDNYDMPQSMNAISYPYNGKIFDTDWP